jgi:hypothetical protein
MRYYMAGDGLRERCTYEIPGPFVIKCERLAPVIFYFLYKGAIIPFTRKKSHCFYTAAFAFNGEYILEVILQVGGF